MPHILVAGLGGLATTALDAHDVTAPPVGARGAPAHRHVTVLIRPPSVPELLARA